MRLAIQVWVEVGARELVFSLRGLWRVQSIERIVGNIRNALLNSATDNRRQLALLSPCRAFFRVPVLLELPRVCADQLQSQRGVECEPPAKIVVPLGAESSLTLRDRAETWKQRACCCETVLRPEKAVDVKDFNIVGVWVGCSFWLSGMNKGSLEQVGESAECERESGIDVAWQGSKMKTKMVVLPPLA